MSGGSRRGSRDRDGDYLAPRIRGTHHGERSPHHRHRPSEGKPPPPPTIADPGDVENPLIPWRPVRLWKGPPPPFRTRPAPPPNPLGRSCVACGKPVLPGETLRFDHQMGRGFIHARCLRRQGR